LRRSPGRFIVIFLIVFLGAGFLAGLQSASPGMMRTADAYYEHTELPDFRLICDLGITEADVKAAQALPNVAQASGGYRVDLKATIGETAGIYAIYAIPGDSTKEGGPSQLSLTEGRLPQNESECVADAYSRIRVGDVIQVAADNNESSLDFFTPRRIKVVGLALSSAYISTTRGNTDIGNGQITNFLYMPREAFTGEYYTELSVRLTTTEGVSAFSDTYETAVAAGRLSLEGFTQLRAEQRRRTISNEAKTELDEAEAEYESESTKVESELNSAKEELETGRLNLDAAIKKYQDYSSALTRGYQELAEGKSKLTTTRQELNEQRERLTAGRTQVAEGRAALEQLTGQRVTLETALSQESDPAKRAVLQGQIDALNLQINETAAQVATGETGVANGEQQLAVGESAYASAESKLQAAEQELARNEKALQTLYSGIRDSMAALNENQDLYNEKADEAKASLDEARSEIDLNWDKWETIEPPVWSIQDRDDFPGYANFAADKDRIASLALILPWFFFIVAAVVCLTTMTRMIEEHRIQIGTLKASGYQRGQIAGIYQSYAWTLGLVGGILGVICGIHIFPQVIWNAYSSMYFMGPFILTFAPLPCLIGALGGVIAISVATALACRKALDKDAAELMRPRAPRSGRHVLLERVPWLWSRLSFRYKVMVRNLMRYRLRFVVTVVGVAGCTALLVAGFGLRDSIAGVVTLHYGEISRVQATVVLDKPSSTDADTALNTVLKEKLTDRTYAYAHAENLTVSFNEKFNGDVITYLLVPEDPAAFHKLINFREPGSHESLEFPPDASIGPAVIITEQLARRLGVNTGDLISFGPSSKPQVQARVSGVMENYVYNYLYCTPETYRALFGTTPGYGSVYVASDMSDSQFEDWQTELVATENVATILPSAQVKSVMEQVIANMNSVVSLMILAAVILAVVVLYNLITLVITERQRELATMKVLGYHRGEVAAFISRETTIMTVIGIALGLGLGIALHRSVMGTIEVSEIMFPRAILLWSFAFAVLFPLLCNLLVNLSARPRLNKVDPATSLKSIE
jgi:putative ABC transport system permease protein